MKPEGLVIVNTGDGKGKTTAALGMMLRAWGHGMQVCMLQFLKSGEANYGEYLAAARIGLEILPLGDGCTWNSKDLRQSKKLAVQAWETAQKHICCGKYDLLVLDEFTLPLHFGWLDTRKVLDWLEVNKPDRLHLVITGRDAPEALIAAADLVTEMNEIHHHYSEQGLASLRGVDH
ncbi:MAG: cob(I)yrinic acid a,c-diamide adenosyltransferase [Anaerolineales bacterium]|nr:cob(I)yrinic acid a,c-diamide adenosyltransferase [Anaerolineales bacterium]